MHLVGRVSLFFNGREDKEFEEGEPVLPAGLIEGLQGEGPVLASDEYLRVSDLRAHPAGGLVLEGGDVLGVGHGPVQPEDVCGCEI